MSSSDPRLSSRSMLRRGSSMRIMVVPYILLRKIYDETISILVHWQDCQNCQDLKAGLPGCLSDTGWSQATNVGVKAMQTWKSWLAVLVIGCLGNLANVGNLGNLGNVVAQGEQVT